MQNQAEIRPNKAKIDALWAYGPPYGPPYRGMDFMGWGGPWNFEMGAHLPKPSG